MTTEAATASEGEPEGFSGGDELSVEALQDKIDIQTQPAEAVCDKFDTFGDVVSFDGDFANIEGVGPATAGELDALEGMLVKQPGTPNDESEESAGDNQADTNDDGEDDERQETEAEVEEDGDEEPAEIQEQNQPAQFSVEIEQSALSEIITAVTRLVDEVKLFVYRDKLKIKTVDNANVAMLDINVSTDAFESFNTAPGVLGVDANRFKEVLGLGESGDSVSLELDTQTRKLLVQIDGLEYDLGLLDPVSIRQTPEIPEDLEIPASITMDTDAIDRGITAADKVSDHIKLSVSEDPEQMLFEAEGDVDSVEYDPTDGDGEAIVEFMPAEACSLFSLEYLKQINRIVKKADTASLNLGENMPAIINTELADGDADITAMLAPRIQS